jgi:hypothetical protein
MLRRRGRPSLVGTMARTAVIAGTATAVSGSVQRGAAQRAADDQQRQAQQQQAMVDQAAAQATANLAAQQAPQQQAAQQTAPSAADDKIVKIRELGQLHADGLLSDAEFAAAKASILGI